MILSLRYGRQVIDKFQRRGSERTKALSPTVVGRAVGMETWREDKDLREEQVSILP